MEKTVREESERLFGMLFERVFNVDNGQTTKKDWKWLITDKDNEDRYNYFKQDQPEGLDYIYKEDGSVDLDAMMLQAFNTGI